MLPLTGEAHDLTIKRLAAGEDNPKPCFAGEEPRSRRAPIFVIEGGLPLSRRALVGALAHRHGLAGQGGLVSLQIYAGNEHAIRRERLAFIDDDKISGYKLRRRDVLDRRVAQHPRLRCQTPGQPFSRRLRAAM